MRDDVYYDEVQQFRCLGDPVEPAQCEEIVCCEDEAGDLSEMAAYLCTRSGGTWRPSRLCDDIPRKARDAGVIPGKSDHDGGPQATGNTETVSGCNHVGGGSESNGFSWLLGLLIVLGFRRSRRS